MTNSSDRAHDTWTVGEVRITRVVEQTMPLAMSYLLPKVTPEDVAANEHWLRPDYVDDEGAATLSSHSYVLETGGRRILVDTGFGNDKERTYYATMAHLKLPYLEELASAGFEPESIDVVACTHLHLDHVGWNTVLRNGVWKPTFPNARYVLNKDEYEYWTQGGPEPSMEADQARVVDDSLAPVVEAGQVDFFTGRYEIAPGIVFEPFPGHSPGNSLLTISSQGEQAVIIGDIWHHPLEIVNSEWAYSDVDPDLAQKARERLLEFVLDKPILVLGTHWTGTSAGYVVTENGSPRVVSDRQRP